MENVWVEIDPAWPADRPRDDVDHDLAEDTRIPKWLEDTALEHRIEIQFSDKAVGEGHAEAEIHEAFDFDDPG